MENEDAKNSTQQSDDQKVREITDAVTAAERALKDARAARREANLRYVLAQAAVQRARKTRDEFIIADPRSTAMLSCLLDMTRSRVAQIRLAAGLSRAAVHPTPESRRLMDMLNDD